MASLLASVFASTYGKNRPKFFWWYEPGTSADEKKLLFKIDFFILTFGCLSYFTKWLDQANLSNAYVSGMKEDLNMVGNEYTLATTCFQVGAILGGIPSNLLLTWVPPRILLPGLELLWGIFTLVTYRVTSANQLYPLRFFVGFFEGSSFVGIQYILGSWYRRTELGKRTSIFLTSAYIGTMISGYLQSAIQASLNGHGGLAAWRWVFIIESVMTMVVAIYGYFFFPDTPETTKAWYLSEGERERCKERLRSEGREPVGEFGWGIFGRMVRSWQFWIFSVLWMFWNTTVGKVSTTVMQMFLKDDTQHTWSVYQINNIPTAISGWNIIVMLLTSAYIDATGHRMGVIVGLLSCLLFGTIILVVWTVPLGLKITSYLFAGLDGPLSPIVMSWANLMCGKDPQVRALTLAFMNSLGAVTTTLIQQFLYPVTTAPEYKKGFRASLGFVCGMCIWVFVVRGFEMWTVRREEKEKAVKNGEKSLDEESQGGVDVVVADDVPYEKNLKKERVEVDDGTSVEVKEASG